MAQIVMAEMLTMRWIRHGFRFDWNVPHSQGRLALISPFCELVREVTKVGKAAIVGHGIAFSGT